MLTETYITTTDPKLTVAELFSARVLGGILVSVLFHTAVYSAFFNLASYVFTGAILSTEINKRLVIALMVVMFLGYIGRFYHVKMVYAAYGRDMKKTTEYINTHYNSWVFLG